MIEEELSSLVLLQHTSSIGHRLSRAWVDVS